ncbi:hypothetical protein RSP03_38490 [Cereibacter sphaeroides]|nr:hypothetical protein RSP03_38490 [Cereibacter sphaeroides]
MKAGKGEARAGAFGQGGAGRALAARQVSVDGTGRERARGRRPQAGAAGRQMTRSTIIFLISAMALAGFRPLGQVLAQFMIVWQR